MGEYYKDSHRYDDIIDLPHHRSRERLPMSLEERAAQFAPFAALTGLEQALEDTEEKYLKRQQHMGKDGGKKLGE